MDNLLPHTSQDIERALIATVLLRGTPAFRAVQEKHRLHAQDFYLQDCATVWSAFESLADQGLDLDILTVKLELETQGCLDQAGGQQNLYQLLDPRNMPSTGLHETYAVKIRETAQRRRLVELAKFIAELAHRDATPVDEIYRKVLESVDGISVGRARPFISAKLGVSSAYDRHMEAHKKRAKTGEAVRGLISGLTAFDRLSEYQFDLGTLMVLFGVTGLGKSTLLANLMAGFASRGTPVLYVTLEMAPDRIVDRVIAGVAGVPENRMRSGEMDENQWKAHNDAIAALETTPWTVTGACQSVSDIESQVGAMTEFYGGKRGVVMVDTINSLKEAGESDNPYIRITNAAIALDQIKLRTGWAIIGAGQQRMDVDPKAGVLKLRQALHPNPTNIQGSRELSQKAEFQFGMYSWEYWNSKIPAYTDPDSHKPGELRIDNIKSRYCQDGTYTVLRHYKGVPCFRDITDRPPFVAGRDDAADVGEQTNGKDII